jgi:hypothetical protein
MTPRPQRSEGRSLPRRGPSEQREEAEAGPKRRSTRCELPPSLHYGATRRPGKPAHFKHNRSIQGGNLKPEALLPLRSSCQNFRAFRVFRS